MKEMQAVTIDTIAGGAAIERANLELNNVLKNIMDPNTSFKIAREVNLKIKIKASEDRSFGEVFIQATSKLAPISEHMTQVYIGTDAHGDPEASEVVEPELPFGEGFEGSNITSIKEGTNN